MKSVSNPRENWPKISYFNSGTKWAKKVLSELEEVETKNWYTLYRAHADGSFWRIDTADKYQQSYLLKIDDLDNWDSFDSTKLEKELLEESRGISDEKCKWAGCDQPALNESAFCVDHTYNQGVRK